MDKSKKIQSIYKILLLYEDMMNNESDVSIFEYKSYLDRMQVLFAYGESEIIEYLTGLAWLGENATHGNVKTSVFRIIKLIEKGGG